MSTSEPPVATGTESQNGTTPPESPASSNPLADELAGLDDRTRAIVERYVTRANDASSEAARHRHEAREARERLQTLERERETEQERRDRETAERERAAGRAERDDEVAALHRQIATGDIRVRAAGRFADPEDAVRMLDVDALLATPEAERVAAVDAALGKLLETKPYLARQSEPRPGLMTQGGRSTPPGGRARERSWLRG
jgi:hypothetical protein